MAGPQKFVKKPVTIEAIQFVDDESAQAILQWVADSSPELVVYIEYTGDHVYGLAIQTLEGTMIATLGDWVIKGIQGEFYPCKPLIFNDSYDLKED